jgi:hypothetical protein
MEVNGQLQAPAALPPGKEPLVPIGYEAGHLYVDLAQNCDTQQKTAEYSTHFINCLSNCFLKGKDKSKKKRCSGSLEHNKGTRF